MHQELVHPKDGQNSYTVDRQNTVQSQKPWYRYAALIVFAFLTIFYFIPQLIDNEAVYLISSRQLIDASFLSNDWAAGAKPDQMVFGFAFSLLIAPLWILLKSPILVALAARFLTWSFLLYGLVNLSKQLQIKWFAFSAGIVLWVLSYQSVAAFEWVFGGAEQKCFGYGFLFLALAYVMERKVVRAALCCSASIYFHILVGGYGAMALSFAMAVCWQKYGFKRLLRFYLITAVLGAPFILLVIRLLSGGGHGDILSSTGMDPDTMYVVFRNPHHMDPNYFLTPKKVIAKLVYCICTYFAIFRVLKRDKVKFILSFLGFLLFVYIFGLIARYFELFSLVKYHPFRVFDTLLPLMFWLTVPTLLLMEGRRLFNSGISAYKRPLIIGSLLALTTLFSMSAIFGYVVPNLKKEVVSFYDSWENYLTQSTTDQDLMFSWIRSNLPTSAILIAPPWLENVWLTSERAVVANFKIAPMDELMLEWRQRMVDLNGGKEFDVVGFKIYGELKQNYPNLSLEKLLDIEDAYGASYYLTPQKNPNVDEQAIIHSNARYFLYDLSLMR